MRLRFEADANEYVAYDERYPYVIGVGFTKKEAIDEFKINLKVYLDYMKELRQHG